MSDESLTGAGDCRGSTWSDMHDMCQRHFTRDIDSRRGFGNDLFPEREKHSRCADESCSAPALSRVGLVPGYRRALLADTPVVAREGSRAGGLLSLSTAAP